MTGTNSMTRIVFVLNFGSKMVCNSIPSPSVIVVSFKFITPLPYYYTMISHGMQGFFLFSSALVVRVTKKAFQLRKAVGLFCVFL